MHSLTTTTTPPERLRIGKCVIDLASREVHVPGARRPVRLTPKALAVLRALAGQPGQVVSRDQLLADVWPDTLPTNDVVTQAITQLRKALAHADDDAGRAGGIETIAKTGYRLLSPVQWESGTEVDDTAEATPSSVGSSTDAWVAAQETAPAVAIVSAGRALPVPARAPARLQLWLTMALMLIALACGAIGALMWFARQGASRGLDADGGEERVVGTPRLPYRLITSGGGFDLTPTLSPDGSMVAYASLSSDRPGSSTSILIKTTDAAAPRRLGSPGKGESDRLPAWSSDGREVAFAREGENRSCRVMVAAANGEANEREVARCDFTDLLSFSWVPGHRALLFGSMTGGNASGGIRELDLETGRWRDLAYNTSPSDFDYLPRYSPDGRWIVFVRNPQMGDLWRMPAEGGEAEPLTRENAEIRGWDWLPDSSGLVFGRRVDSQSRLYRLDLARLRLHDLTLTDAESPSVAMATGKLAFVQRRPHYGLYRVQRNESKPGYARTRLFASNGRDAQPMVSPDGRQLVFNSDRSGEYAMWWAQLDRPDSLHPIEGLVPETRQPADWSPQSSTLLTVGRNAEGRPLLYEVQPAKGRVDALPAPVDRPLQGLYTNDPSRVLVLAGEEAGGASLGLYDRSSKPWRLLKQLEDVSQVRLDRASGNVLFTRFSDVGLWRIDSDLEADSLRQVDAVSPSRWRYRSWAADGQGRAVYLSSSADCATLGTPLGGQGDQPECVAEDRFTTVNGFSIDPRDGSLFLALAVT
ncbi:MAG TPA: winged helix-turn-helix domain-containing protein, partial [Stenotrophomonas sp.]